MAAAMAMGGAWTGSMWLATSEAETSQVIKEKYVQANSRQTVRSKAERVSILDNSGRSTDAWESGEGQSPCPCRSITGE